MSEHINEDLRKWFREKWVNLAKKKKGGGYEECGTSGDKKGYAKCVPAAKAARMSGKEVKSAVRRKRAAQTKAGRPGKEQPGQGNKPIMVKTFKEAVLLEKNKPTNSKLWGRAKALAKQKFDVYPSAYANAWAAKWYRKKGGGWRSTNEAKGSCWEGYRQAGMKMKNGRMVPNCVPVTEELGKENEWGRPELTKKMMDATPGQGKNIRSFKEFVEVTPETAVYHSELNPAVWQDMELKSEVRQALLRIAQDFIKTWEIELPIKDIILTGSNANYNWTKFSDFDLHVIVNMGEYGVTRELVKNLLNTKKNLYNNQHNIKIRGYDVELYAQDMTEPHIASGQYSLMHNRWLVVPTNLKPTFMHTNIQKKAAEVVRQIEEALASEDVEALRAVLKKIAKMRQSGLEKGGEFSDENMAFKVLRNSGMIEKIRQAITDLGDKALSLNGDTEKLEEALTPKGRIKKQIAIRRNRWKLNRRRKIAKSISASQRRIGRRTKLTAVRTLYKTLANVKSRKGLSTTQKAALERVVKSRGKAYRKSLEISTKPKLRVADIKRVTKATKYKV